MASSQSRSTAEKVAIFRSCFSGLTHVYGTYNVQTGLARQAKEPVTDQVVLRHIMGQQPYGVYLLTGDHTRAVVVDFDHDDPVPVQEYVRAAGQYGIPVYVERSKRKGWHAWTFAELPGVSALKARLVVNAALADIGQSSNEVFPRHDRLSRHVAFGNYINAPLFGLLVPQGRTVFVDVANGMRAYADQWSLLQYVQRVTERQLEEIVEINELGEVATATATIRDTEADQPTKPSFGLPPCAQRVLVQGVTENQRVTCFWLAVQMKKAGIPEDITITALMTWAAKNQPTGGKGIITDAEIVAQVRAAYAKPYRGCGCEVFDRYCAPQCPLRKSPLRSRSHLPGPAPKK